MTRNGYQVIKKYICISKKINVLDVSYFHLSHRHLKLPTIGPFENTQGGHQRTTHWMWERRVEQHLVLDQRHSQVSVDKITRWVYFSSQLSVSYCYIRRVASFG